MTKLIMLILLEAKARHLDRHLRIKISEKTDRLDVAMKSFSSDKIKIQTNLIYTV